LERRLAAILAADVVGYSRLMGADEGGTLERLKTLRRDLVQPKITERGGRIVKLMGDGLLAEFPSVVEAVQCAVDVQEAMEGRDAELADDRRIVLRIGVNLGDVMVEGSDIYGDGVNVAARLEALAEPGGLCLSGAAFDMVEGKLDAAFEDMGERRMKNIAKPVRVYHLTPSGVQASGTDRLTGALPLPDKPSIAILPFTNMSGDSEQDYFSDGITEDIITELSRFSSLFVIARNSSFAYKGQAVDVRRVAEELGVRFVLEGSIRRAAERVRITAQLIDSETGSHIWAERYDRELNDLFDLQEDITRNVVTSIAPQIEMAEIERVRAGRIRNLTAYDLALKAKAVLFDGISVTSPETVERAIAAAEEALAVDPRNVEALWAQGFGFHMLYTWGSSSDPEALNDRAWKVVQRLSEIDATNPYGCMISGAICWDRGEYDQGIAHMRRGYELNPNFAWNLISLAWCESLAGLTDEAREHAELGIRLSPRDMDFWLGTAYLALAQAHFADRDFAAAKDMGSRALALKPSSLRGAIVAASCAHLGEAEEAARRLKELKAIGSDFLASLLDGSYTLYRNPGHNALLVDGLRTAESPRGDVEAPPSEALPLPDKPSIAVLPFNNMSGDQEQDYFSDGITEDIITELSRFPTLFVIARNSSFSYKGQAVDVRRVAEELGVRYVLEGSIRRAGSRVRITAQLIDSETGKHVWAERYDRNLEDIFALQEEITANVVGAIAPQIEMAEIDRVRGVRSGNVSAYDLALKSQALFYDGARKGSPEIHRQALDTAAAALEQDPRNAHALWIRAWACVEGYLYRWGPDPDELLKEAWTAVERLVDVDSSDPRGYSARGMVEQFRGNYEAAVADHRYAFALNPNFAVNLFTMAWSESLAGYTDEAREHAALGLRLSPRDNELWLGVAYLALAQASFADGDYEATEKWARLAVQMHPRAPIRRALMIACCVHNGDLEGARKHANELASFAPEFIPSVLRGDITLYNDPVHNALLVEGLSKAGAET
jgi:TolB-like protein/class 3 adenylate cyclase/lipopolysaccharide biosynthesis regulator YciM